MKKLLALVVCLVLFSGLAFGSGTKQVAGKAIELRHMSPHTAGSAFFDIFNAAIDEFMKENPGVNLIHDSLPSKELRTKITVEMAAGNPPDSSWLILSYAREFMKTDQIIDWKPVYDDPRHPEFKEWFDDKILSFSKYKDGRYMMAPYELSMDGMWYNSEMFAQKGWGVPNTFDEFLGLAAKARGDNMYLMSAGGKDIRFAWLASILLARTGGVDNADKLALGDALTEWDNPKYGFPQAMEKFKAMVDAEVYPPGLLGLSTTEADQMFVRGDVAMYYEGAWKPGNFENIGGKEFIDKVRRIDFPAMPDMPMGDPKAAVGGTIIGLIVAENIPDAKKQMAIKWIKKISSPEFFIPIIEMGTNLYAGEAPYDRAKVNKSMNQAYDAFLAAPRLLPSMDAYAPPAIDLAIKKTAMPGIVTGEFDVAEALAEVQKAALEYAKTLQ